jgi:hypothetical protein
LYVVMSERAARCYTEQAEWLDIDHVPEVLNGEPIALLPDTHLSVHYQAHDKLDAITGALRGVLSSTHDFILAGVPDRRALEPGENDERSQAKGAKGSKSGNTHFLNAVADSLLIPTKISTGTISKITVEAIAHDDVKEAIANRLVRPRTIDIADRFGRYDLTQASFVISAMLKSGRNQLPVAGLILARAITTQETDVLPSVTTVRYAGGPLSRIAIEEAGLLSGNKQEVRQPTTIRGRNLRVPSRRGTRTGSY